MYLNIILLLNMGLAGGEMEPFIVGGDYVDIKQFPHSVYLFVDCENNFICGGSVLNSHAVLTAAHCIHECQKSLHYSILVNYGHSTISKMKSLSVSHFLVHDEYDADVMTNDISLLYTEKPIPFGEVVQRVAILSRFPTLATGGHVTGWGVINSEKEMSLSMKYIYQELQDRQMCKDLIGLPEGTFCAQNKDKDQFPEQGDSGGAFVVYHFIQIGIVSFKHVDYNIIAYTNVTYFYKWIKNKVMRLSCDKVV